MWNSQNNPLTETVSFVKQEKAFSAFLNYWMIMKKLMLIYHFLGTTWLNVAIVMVPLCIVYVTIISCACYHCVFQACQFLIVRRANKPKKQTCQCVEEAALQMGS